MKDFHRFKHLFNQHGEIRHEDVPEADSEDGNEYEEHETTKEITLKVPEQFLVTIEGVAEEADGSYAIDFDFQVIVPKISINHFTYVLQMNGIPHRVEPLP